MTINFILCQIAGGIALILVAISYFLKTKKAFLFFQTIANFFYASSFLFQELWVAGIGSMISLVRALGLFILENKGIKPSEHYFIILMGCYFINASILYQVPMDIIPLCTSCLFTLAFFVKDMQKVRYFMILPNFVLVVYGILTQCYTNALLDAMELVVLFVAIFYFIKDKREKSVKKID